MTSKKPRGERWDHFFCVECGSSGANTVNTVTYKIKGHTVTQTIPFSRTAVHTSICVVPVPLSLFLRQRFILVSRVSKGQSRSLCFCLTCGSVHKSKRQPLKNWYLPLTKPLLLVMLLIIKLPDLR